MKIGLSLTIALFLFRCSTNETMPPSYWNLWFLPSRSSSIVMRMPPLRNASSRSRCASVSKLYSIVSKICGSGLNVTLVPRLCVVPVTSSVARRSPALVALLVDVAVAPDFEVEPLRQRVDDRHADAVQAAGHLVAVVVELAAGVQHGQHDFGGRLAAGVPIDGNAAAVVDDGDRVVDVDRDVDLVAVAGQRLVDRVVDDLVDEVVQPGRTGRPDVHGRPLPHGLEAFEDLDLVRAVVVGRAVAVRDRGGVPRRREWRRLIGAAVPDVPRVP